MSDTPAYTIGELAARAGVSVRTVRYYVAEGLLPPPDTRGPTARYGDEHLLRLQAVARLKAAYLPLAAIRERLAQLDEPALRALLAAPPPADAVAMQLPPAPRAATGPVLLAEGRAPYAPGAPEREGTAGPPALGRIELSDEPAAIDPPVRPRGSFPWQRQAPAAQQLAAERWQRVALAPGVELHLREPIAPAAQAAIGALVAQARRLLGEEAANAT